ncbi:DUF4393 domain-containing protein [Cryobacterium sp. TMS1-20-1]|uniref:DUF4393 domain-containing protein n=1 Tax=Cryobacterium sp. TMS1-20-1 TaxID=1259223 RepID=UPI00106D451E|nr:DUF4393 domain-containing protein [Cryobacterium sp. TMS1-20-1]TFC79407.1 DUF4393 domain-containing protein [Cryobacterium sp. TMS1-20-1]
MTHDQPLKNAKAIVNLTTDIMQIAKENPDAQEAGQYAAKSLRIVAQTVHTVLLPLAAANFAILHFADYMKNKFEKELADLTGTIPPENLISPKSSVAGPAIQGLAFTHEEQSLKDMYLNLIATAMDGRISKRAHPAFVEIVKQIDGREADTLRSLLRGSEMLAIVEIRTSESAWNVLERNIIDLKRPSGEPAVSPEYAVWIDNWVRLGLFELTFMSFLSSPHAYDWVESRPEYQLHKGDNALPILAKGVLKRTSFGDQFAEAIGARTAQATAGQIPLFRPEPRAKTPIDNSPGS